MSDEEDSVIATPIEATNFISFQGNRPAFLFLKTAEARVGAVMSPLQVGYLVDSLLRNTCAGRLPDPEAALQLGPFPATAMGFEQDPSDPSGTHILLDMGAVQMTIAIPTEQMIDAVKRIRPIAVDPTKKPN